ncbi:hypothetical protein [Candidatus Nardonella dryophthoridicola]|uniref:Uncharacterized protein n=1 Tax=endosymbiont of Metamasius hemipterus TaxID=204627 RepID=A0ABT0TWD7_9GAMM|nr:hypothetical protein [Candidatus Nardonella dryophthoridicola]MCM0158312.1 hypothetical protein [endosymbiont of Metamasius hemipterus]
MEKHLYVNLLPIKSVKKIDIDNIKKINININNLKKFLGPRKFNHNIYEIKKPGTALGLA